MPAVHVERGHLGLVAIPDEIDGKPPHVGRGHRHERVEVRLGRTGRPEYVSAREIAENAERAVAPNGAAHRTDPVALGLGLRVGGVEVREADPLVLGDTGGELRPIGVARADIPPGPRPELRNTALVEEALGTHPRNRADPCPRRHRDHRPVGRVIHRGQTQLVFGARRAADRPDPPVRPRLRGNPRQRVVSIGPRSGKESMGSLGPLGSALILDHDRVALAHQPGEERAAHFAFLEVRGPDQNRRQLVADAGADHSGGKPDPVPHRHHDHPLHRGEVGNAHPLK